MTLLSLLAHSNAIQMLPRFYISPEHMLDRDPGYCLPRDITFGLHCIMNGSSFTGLFCYTRFVLDAYLLATKMIPYSIPLFKNTRYSIVEQGYQKSIVFRGRKLIHNLRYTLYPIPKHYTFTSFLLILNKMPVEIEKDFLPAMTLYCTVWQVYLFCLFVL